MTRLIAASTLAGAIGAFLTLVALAYISNRPMQCAERCTVIEKVNVE